MNKIFIGYTIRPFPKKMSSANKLNSVVSSLTRDESTIMLLDAHGLKAQSVSWEDTGRSKGSCWGPNISDMTLVVKESSTLMPVIRKPNFADVTQDVPIETFNVNHKGTVKSLKALLEELKLYDDRDSVVLTSSQCCVLPVEFGKKTQFAVQLFNYQSRSEDPAVLVILASKNGTSVQVLDSSNTKLFFDDLGTAKWFSVERLEDVRIRAGDQKTRVDSFKEMKAAEVLDNTIMMIQVPLKQKPRPQTRSYFGGNSVPCSTNNSVDCIDYSYKGGDEYEEEDCEADLDLFGNAPKDICASTNTTNMQKFSRDTPKPRGMDMGQVGLGDSAGTYTGVGSTTLTRDERFPVRCTFQYYRVTDTGKLDEKSILDIKEQLEQSLKVATAQGSLVLNPDSGRLTEPVLSKPVTKPTVLDQPSPWINAASTKPASFL